MSKLKLQEMLPMLITVFIDLLGTGMIIPILAPLVVASSSDLFLPNTSIEIRSLVFGLLLAAYPISQFFGAPVLGTVSDRIGRKPVLSISLIGTAASYILFGYGMVINNIWLMFGARLLDGFTGGNLAMIYSAVADTSSKSERHKNFGYIGAAYGAGMILGPVIGSILSDKDIVRWFTNTTPFWFAAALALVNSMLVSSFFPETINHKGTSKLDLLSGLKNIKKIFQRKNLTFAYASFFAFYVGFYMFIQFFPAFLVPRFNMNETHIGYILTYTGIWAASAQVFMTNFVSQKESIHKTLRIAMLLVGLSFLLLLLPSKRYELYLILPIAAIILGIVQPALMYLLSESEETLGQGQLMGMTQSVQAITQIVAPITGALLVTFGVATPLIVASMCCVLAWLVLYKAQV